MKRHLFHKMLTALIVPLLMLLLAELALRGARVSFPNELMIPVESGGRPMWEGNPFFAYRFFIPPLARTPSPILTDRDKPEGRVRIVVLGESAAQGDPVPAFGPARMLGAWLQRRYPDRDVEVVNAAVTAVSSPIIRDLAAELKKLEPDVVILYIGNNEVIGPYGPVTRISRLARGDVLQRAAVRLTRLRLAQVASQVMAMMAEMRGAIQFQGVARALHHPVAFDDPRLEPMRRQFARNLRAIVAAARGTGARVLLCTMAANHTDCPPALSVHRPDLSWPDRQAWEQAYERGVAAFGSRNWSAALGHFDAASAKDDAYAELVYRRAVCLQQLGRMEDAEPAFARALDLDAFRYRVDSRLNDAIRTLGASLAGEAVLVDVAEAFRNHGASRDADWFVDHVHFSFEGTYELARLWADALALVPPFRDFPMAADGALSLEDAKTALLFTPVAELGFASALLGRYSQPPFSQQFDVDERVAAYNRRLGALTLQIQSLDVDQLDARFAAHEERNPGDLTAPFLRGQLLLSFNRYGKVAEALGPVIRRQPHRRDLRALLARSLAALGRADEAADMLVGWTRRHGFLAAQAVVGHMNELVQNGQEDEALAYGRAVAARLRASDYRWRIGRAIETLDDVCARRDRALAAMQRGDPAAAAAAWADLMQRRSDWPVAPYWLSVIRSSSGNREEGLALIQRALNHWGYARACYHVGLWEARFGDAGKARDYFQQAARAAGDDQRLANSLAWVLTAHPNPAVRDPALAQERFAPAEPPPPGFAPMDFF